MPATVEQLRPGDFCRFRDLIYRHSGIRLGGSKAGMLQGRLLRRLRRLELRSFRAYYEAVLSDPSGRELNALIDAVSTNKTAFFRERGHFTFLERELLPGLLSRKEEAEGAGRRLRMWSAACATGEEAYSLAMTAERCRDDAPGEWDIRLLATDISTRALGRAVRGAYGLDRVRPIPRPDLRRWFVLHPEGLYRVRPALARRITFARLNLLQKNYPFRGPFDVIFCRNVMLYFGRASRERLVNRLFHHLAPGGHLFIGHSESLSDLSHPFAFVRPAVFRRDP